MRPTYHKFLSTLSLRRATLNLPSKPIDKNISIHALLAESDRAASVTPAASRNFYPRSPCGERPPPYNLMIHHVKFLSTLSLRRATVGQKRLRQKLAISIHALLAESDDGIITRSQLPTPFLSTLSLRRATTYRILRAKLSPISIHALLAESDRAASITPTASRNFYPRSPCGERQRSRL